MVSQVPIQFLASGSGMRTQGLCACAASYCSGMVPASVMSVQSVRAFFLIYQLLPPVAPVSTRATMRHDSCLSFSLPCCGKLAPVRLEVTCTRVPGVAGVADRICRSYQLAANAINLHLPLRQINCRAHESGRRGRGVGVLSDLSLLERG